MRAAPGSGYLTPNFMDREDDYFKQDAHINRRKQRDVPNSNIPTSADVNAHTAMNDGSPLDRNSANQIGGNSVGLRDRISCYTWTWFTMTMATGGMANVLHSSKVPLKAGTFLGLTASSSVSSRLAPDHWCHNYAIQHWSIFGQLHLLGLEVHLGSRLIHLLVQESERIAFYSGLCEFTKLSVDLLS